MPDKFNPFKNKPAVEPSYQPPIVPPKSNIVAMNPLQRNAAEPAIRTTSAVTLKDVEDLGADIQTSMGATTDKIVASMKVSQAGDLGSLLVQVQSQAERLDPTKQFGGIFGWIRKRTVNIKSYLKQEFATTEKVFDELKTDISKRIAANDSWIKNLDQIFDENQTNYGRLVSLIAKGTAWAEAVKIQVDNYPVIDPMDPNAMMLAQDQRDLQSLYNRITQKVDTFKRMKMLAENNAPKIRTQQQTSYNTMTTLRDIMDFVIPTIKTEFALYLHSIETKSDQDLIANMKTMSQQTLIKSADAASTSAIDAAKNLNAPMVDNPTLDYLRQKIVDTVVAVKSIESESAKSREADALTMQSSTNQFIKQLSSN